MNSRHNAGVPAALDAIKVEYDTLVRECKALKMHSDVLETKLKAQLLEMNRVLSTIGTMEKSFQSAYDSYEAEIKRLRELAGEPSDKPFRAAPLRLALPDVPDAPVVPVAATPTPTSTTDAHHGYSPDTPEPRRRGRPLGRTKRSRGEPSTVITFRVPEASELVPPASDWLAVYYARTGRDATSTATVPPAQVPPGSDYDSAVRDSTLPLPAVRLEHTVQMDSVVCSLAFACDGSALAAGGDRVVALFDVDNGAVHRVIEVPAGADKAPGESSYIRALAFSPDGQLVVGGTEHRTLEVWDTDSGEHVHSLAGHARDVYSVQWSRDSRLLASGSGDHLAKVWDWSRRVCVRDFGDANGPTDGVTSVALSPNAALLAVASLDHTVRVWDVESGALRQCLDSHSDGVYSIAFSPDGRTLASGSLDKTVRLWNVNDGACCSVLHGHEDFVLSVAFMHDGDWLVSGAKDRTIRCWDARRSTPHVVLDGHANSVISVAASPRQADFASGGGDCAVRIWNLAAPL